MIVALDEFGDDDAFDEDRPDCESRCSVDGCDRRVHCHATGFCNPHNQRFRRTGDPGLSEIQPMAKHGDSARRVCRVRGCERHAPYATQQLCVPHYRRLRLYGDPEGTRTYPRGREHWATIDEPGYSAMHSRVKSERGPACAHECAHCGGRARDWAYDHSDPNPRYWRGHPFSLDKARYIPLCRRCHYRLDRAVDD